jgi:hypothetical protein
MHDGKKALRRLQAEGKARKVVKSLKEKDKELVDEIKRIKNLQKGLYKEYEIEELGDD